MNTRSINKYDTLIRAGSDVEVQSKIKKYFSKWSFSFSKKIADSTSNSSHHKDLLLLEAVISHGKVRYLEKILLSTNATSYYVKKAFISLVSNSNNICYCNNYPLLLQMLSMLQGFGLDLDAYRQQIAKTGNIQSLKELMCLLRIENPFLDPKNILDEAARLGNLSLVVETLKVYTPPLQMVVTLVKLLRTQPQQDSKILRDIYYQSHLQVRHSFSLFSIETLTEIMVEYAKLCKLVCEPALTLKNKKLYECNNRELFITKSWLIILKEQLESKPLFESELSSEFIQLRLTIISILNYINNKFKFAVKYEYIRRLIDAFDKDKATKLPLVGMLFKKYDTRLVHFESYAAKLSKDSDKLIPLKEFIKHCGDSNGQVSDRHLHELYDIVRQHKLKTPVKEDFFHKPHCAVNQVYFRLAWLLGRISEFDMSEIFPPYQKGLDSWWEQVGHKPQASHIYELPFDDIYCDTMTVEDKTPAIYSVAELKEDFAEKAIIPRDKSEIGFAGQLSLKPFTSSQMRTLFKERSDIAEYSIELHANELKNMKRIRKQTVDELERLGDEIYQYSNHHPKYADSFTKAKFNMEFSEETANKLVGNLLRFLENLPPEEKNALVNITTMDTTLKDIIHSITIYGCTGQIGEFIRSLVRKIREIYTVVEAKETLQTPYSQYVGLVDLGAKPHVNFPGCE